MTFVLFDVTSFIKTNYLDLIALVLYMRFACLDMLYLLPPDEESEFLPSPEELKGRIIVKVRSKD